MRLTGWAPSVWADTMVCLAASKAQQLTNQSNLPRQSLCSEFKGEKKVEKNDEKEVEKKSAKKSRKKSGKKSRKKSRKKSGKKLKGEKKVERGKIEHKICMALIRLRSFRMLFCVVSIRNDVQFCGIRTSLLSPSKGSRVDVSACVDMNKY